MDGAEWKAGSKGRLPLLPCRSSFISPVPERSGGVLTIENGTYKHLGGTAMAYVIDNSANSFGDAYLYVNGGSIKSENYIAIQQTKLL
mgnify:CR=1 FL=1